VRTQAIACSLVLVLSPGAEDVLNAGIDEPIERLLKLRSGVREIELEEIKVTARIGFYRQTLEGYSNEN